MFSSNKPWNAGIALSALLVTGCAGLATNFSHLTNVAPKNAPAASPTPFFTPATPTPVPTQEPPRNTVTLSMKADGAANPVGPEDLTSVVVAGVTIPASEIQFKTSPFKTQAESSSDYQVAYEGAGKYHVVNKKTGKVLENRALIVFNLVNAKDPMIVPVLQGILENNVKMTIDLATGNIFGGITRPDGTVDDTKAVFKIGTDGKMTVTEPGGKQSVFARNDSSSTNLPDPENVVELTAEEVQAQLGSVAAEIPAAGPIVDYVGLWLYSGLGQKIISQLKDVGENKFSGSVTINGTAYSGLGDYNPAGKNETLTLKVATDSMHIEIAKVGNNALTLTLKSTSNEQYKTFQNVPVNLQRVRVTD